MLVTKAWFSQLQVFLLTLDHSTTIKLISTPIYHQTVMAIKRCSHQVRTKCFKNFCSKLLVVLKVQKKNPSKSRVWKHWHKEG